MRNLKSLATTLGLSLAVLATSGWLATARAQATDQPAPAPDTSTAAPAKPMHHKHAMHKASAPKSEAGDAAVDDLNAKSLDAAKSGKPFSPAAAAPVPEKKSLKPIHHHHMKKPAAPAPDAAPK